jgi:hypothetical protein
VVCGIADRRSILSSFAWWSLWAFAGIAGDVVTDARDGLDCRWVSELSPKSADRDLDDVGEGVGVFVPDLLEEALGAEDRVLGSHQRFEHGELSAGEIEVPSVAGGGVV